jgi:hypothetical protein
MSARQALGWAVFIIVIVWGYLIAASRMDISADAIGYQDFGRQISEQGLPGIFLNGPNREPVFPLMIAGAMRLGAVMHVDYQIIQKVMHLGVILLSLGLMALILRRLKVRPRVMLAVLLYWGLSPAIINSGMSLFSEIATYPVVLLLILAVLNAWERAWEGRRFWRASAVLCALAAMGVVLVKSYFEIGFIFFFAPFLGGAGYCLFRKDPSRAWRLFAVFILSAGLVFSGCHVYRSLNDRYNGQYAMTDRGSWALYGKTVRRVEPLTIGKIKAAILTIPGEGICRKFASEKDCFDVSYLAGDLPGMTEIARRLNSGMSKNEVNRSLVRESVQMIERHPWQCAFYSSCEWVKFLFWETTKTGFVMYPGWLERVYASELVRYALRCWLALVTLGAIVWGIITLGSGRGSVFERRFIAWALLFIAVTAVLYSVFSVLTRYVFMVVPLYLILAALWVDRGLMPAKGRSDVQ